MFVCLHRPLATDTLAGKPLYNHILSSDECLSEPFTVLQLNMKTVTVPQLEVYIASYVTHCSIAWILINVSNNWYPLSVIGIIKCA